LVKGSAKEQVKRLAKKSVRFWFRHKGHWKRGCWKGVVGEVVGEGAFKQVLYWNFEFEWHLNSAADLAGMINDER